ncbi:DinB family protein [Breznakiella homolactica]|uniref:DinB family protein n=1 Tax=Breznakiella homolactica TaxID=2798577 RepID=A0A7T7XPT3_9SPIR|nr:DinB family protein [Breznakiella homolactica]QQO10270.1 DinB family protein [Breznakiella homolactica]
MATLERDWNPKFEALKKSSRNTKNYRETIGLTLELHSLVHFSDMSGYTGKTFYDEIWDGLSEEVFRYVPPKKGMSIAWYLWHLNRIEDLVSNILINDSKQVFNKTWQKKLKTKFTDTGNAMDRTQVTAFSAEVGMQELYDYTNAVGRQTEKILKSLGPEDLSRKPEQGSLDRLLPEGGLTEEEGSIWLRDFWGKKTVAGLMMLPLTRHHLMHIPQCLAIKKHVAERTPAD